MFKDSIVLEIHALRQQHAEKFDFDLQAIMADIQRQEQNSGVKFVNRPPRRPRTWKAPITHGPDQAANS